MIDYTRRVWTSRELRAAEVACHRRARRDLEQLEVPVEQAVMAAEHRIFHSTHESIRSTTCIRS